MTEHAEITLEMIDAGLRAYWGNRPYNRRGRKDWSEKEREGMRDAIAAAFACAHSEHRIGEYVADYTMPTKEEIHAPNKELDDLLANSRPNDGEPLNTKEG